MIRKKLLDKNPSISVVIPAYKAGKFIEKNLTKVKKSLDGIRHSYEIICVVDGDTDNTLNNARKAERKYPDKIKVVGYENNMGKGHAVRYGMARANGDIVGFVDAGMDINPNSISLVLEHFEWYSADIIVGSKRHPVSKVKYPWERKIVSYGYQIIVKILFGLKVKDTQVGLKFYRREVLKKVLPRLLVKAFAFDVEILAVANYLGFKKIYEAPVVMDMEFGKGLSTITSGGFIKTSFLMGWDTLAVFYRLKIKKYYDENNQKNWITPKYLTFTKK